MGEGDGEGCGGGLLGGPWAGGVLVGEGVADALGDGARADGSGLGVGYPLDVGPAAPGAWLPFFPPPAECWPGLWCWPGCGPKTLSGDCGPPKMPMPTMISTPTRSTLAPAANSTISRLRWPVGSVKTGIGGAGSRRRSGDMCGEY